jgi:Fe-S-cluster containining protein
LFDKTAQWFDRAKAALLDELPCSRGCSHCCIGLFPVTILDRLQIQRGLRLLCSEERQAIVQRARRQVELIEAEMPELRQDPFIDRRADRDIDALVERYRELPCPALASDGSCAVYAWRPLTCRSMGLPQEVEGVVHGACAVQVSVPVRRLPRSCRDEEDRLAAEEAEQIARLRAQDRIKGEELLLPYAFLGEGTEETAG